MSTRNRLVVIGSGLMGSGIAARSALAGVPTILTDTVLEKAQSGISAAYDAIDELLLNHLVSQESATLAKTLLSCDAPMENALDKAFFVIEAVYENLPLKQKIFEVLDKALPVEVPIASNTSGLRITDIASLTKHPERCVTTHFWFPAHLVPLVEIVMSESTEESIALSVRQWLLDWGKAPVVVRKDYPGQLANRILQAVIRESVNIVEMGLASAEDVDTAVKMGMGIRFPAWGPLEHIDAVGLDLAVSVQDTVLPHISTSEKASDYIRTLQESGQLGYKTGTGMYDWSKKDMTELAKKRNEFIIHALQKVQPEGIK